MNPLDGQWGNRKKEDDGSESRQSPHTVAPIYKKNLVRKEKPVFKRSLFFSTEWTGLIGQLFSGEIDAGCELTVTEERMEAVDFSLSVAEVLLTLIVLEEEEADAGDLRLAIFRFIGVGEAMDLEEVN